MPNTITSKGNAQDQQEQPEAQQAIHQVRRTQSQAVLYFVSVVMIVLGGVVTLLGVLLTLLFAQGRLGSAGSWGSGGTLALCVLIAAAGLLVLATGILGLRAADNYARIAPYRKLCYLVCLLILLVLGWGWSNGTLLLFDPIVLAATVIYVLVCSELADRVERDYVMGIRGRLVERSNGQQSLHTLSALLVGEGTLFVIVAIALIGSGMAGMDLSFLASGAQDAARLEELGGSSGRAGLAASIGVPGLACMLVGALGMYGSDHPKHLSILATISVIGIVLNVASLVGEAVHGGFFGQGTLEPVISLLLCGAFLTLSLRIQKTQQQEAARDGDMNQPD